MICFEELNITFYTVADQASSVFSWSGFSTCWAVRRYMVSLASALLLLQLLFSVTNLPPRPPVVFSTLFSFSGCSYYSDSSQEEMELGKWTCGRVWVLGFIRVPLPKHSLMNVSSKIFCESKATGYVDTFPPHRKRGQARLETVLSFFSFRRLKLGVLGGESHLILITTPTTNTTAASCSPFKPLNHPSQLKE